MVLSVRSGGPVVASGIGAQGGAEEVSAARGGGQVTPAGIGGARGVEGGACVVVVVVADGDRCLSGRRHARHHDDPEVALDADRGATARSARVSAGRAVGCGAR
jgi:hypothetical protein